jgi:hypothetical protein
MIFARRLLPALLEHNGIPEPVASSATAVSNNVYRKNAGRRAPASAVAWESRRIR